MVYLIHFAKPLAHSRHYIGYTPDEQLKSRIDKHRKTKLTRETDPITGDTKWVKHGEGANIMGAVNTKGIGWEVVRIWPTGDRTLERKLKDTKKSRVYCPICSAKAKTYRFYWKNLNKPTAAGMSMETKLRNFIKKLIKEEYKNKI